MEAGESGMLREREDAEEMVGVADVEDCMEALLDEDPSSTCVRVVSRG
jgi:hypothetical protein